MGESRSTSGVVRTSRANAGCVVSGLQRSVKMEVRWRRGECSVNADRGIEERTEESVSFRERMQAL